MKKLTTAEMHDFIYEYFKDLEYAYEILKETDGKTLNEFSIEQYRYLCSCEIHEYKFDKVDNTCTQRFRFLEKRRCLVCRYLEFFSIPPLCLPCDSIFIERIGSTDDIEHAKFKCDLLLINNCVEEMKEILFMLGIPL